MDKKQIKISTIVNSDIDKAWEYWTNPDHISRWNNASDDWHTTKVENDLRKGGRFTFRMEAKDGSGGFDFGGNYDEVEDREFISYTLDDDRKVQVSFVKKGDHILVVEKFEPESQNPEDMQRDGWKAILDNYKKYVENN